MSDPGGDNTDTPIEPGAAEPSADVEAVFLPSDGFDEEAPPGAGNAAAEMDQDGPDPAPYDVAAAEAEPVTTIADVAEVPVAEDDAPSPPPVDVAPPQPPPSIFEEAAPAEPAPVTPDPWDLLAVEPEPAAVTATAEVPEVPLAELAPIILDDEATVTAVTDPEEDDAGVYNAPQDQAEEAADDPDDNDDYEPAALSYESAGADAAAAVVAGRSDRWSIPVLCAGICLVACCVLIPAADTNRRAAYERQRLQTDLDSLRKQVEVNDRFLSKVADDPTLAERLAQRQLRIVREGSKVLELEDLGGDEMSPYHLVTVAPPPPVEPYRPKGGLLARLCYNPKSRLYVMGVGLLMIAAGLVMNAHSKEGR